MACDLRHIVIELAAARQQGQYLTMKQLVLLRGGTATTVRRRVAHLLVLGHVVKRPHHSDGRSDHFDVSDGVWAQMTLIQSSLQLVGAGIRARAANGGQSTKARNG